VESILSDTRLSLEACPYTLALGDALPIEMEADTIWPVNESNMNRVAETGRVFIEGTIKRVEDRESCFRFHMVSSMLLF
jgi:hypothetical protein